MFSPAPPPEDDPLWARGRAEALDPYAVLDTAPEQAFDDIAHLASTLCQAPIALVSLVAGDRQWFKAKVGVELCQTGLDQSICKFVLAEPDLLVIEDLSQDPRTWGNPVVVGEPHLRFYAGAPLSTGEGDVLGSLCVVDTQPRPAGLSEAQAHSLRRLARLVVQQMEMHRLVQERDGRLAEQEILDETRGRIASADGDPDAVMRAVVHGARLVVPAAQGAAVGLVEGDEIVYRATDGTRIPHLGLRLPKSASLAGWCVRTGAPALVRDVEDDPRLPPSQVALLGVRSALCAPLWGADRAVGALTAQSSRVGAFSQRDLHLLALLAGMATAAFSAANEAAAVQALQLSEQRHRALLELGDRLRDSDSAAEIAGVAAEIIGRELGASVTGHGTVDPRAETVNIESAQHTPEVAWRDGTYAFRDFGSYIDELKAGAVVIVADVESDPRTCANAASFRAIGVRTLVNIPVMERGELVAITVALFAAPRPFSPEDVAFVRTLADRARAGIARVRVQEQQAILNHEISHRLKNTLAMVQAIASQTLRTVGDRDAVDAFGRRLSALATAHDILLASNWTSADLGAVVRRATANLGVEDQVLADGPATSLGPRATLSTSLVIHELTTNAMKYGALSTPGGRVEVRWSLDGAVDDPVLSVFWTERGGPKVSAPGRGGFGSRLLKMGLIGTGGSALSYEPEGFSAVFTAPVRQIQAS